MNQIRSPTGIDARRTRTATRGPRLAPDSPSESPRYPRRHTSGLAPAVRHASRTPFTSPSLWLDGSPPSAKCCDRAARLLHGRHQVPYRHVPRHTSFPSNQRPRVVKRRSPPPHHTPLLRHSLLLPAASAPHLPASIGGRCTPCLPAGFQSGGNSREVDCRGLMARPAHAPTATESRLKSACM
jgi:hypothetical protein